MVNKAQMIVNFYKMELETAARQMKENRATLAESQAAFRDLLAWLPTLIEQVPSKWLGWFPTDEDR